MLTEVEMKSECFVYVPKSQQWQKYISFGQKLVKLGESACWVIYFTPEKKKFYYSFGLLGE